MKIAIIIKSIRKELGLSQQAFADAIHLSFSTINRWENGRANPTRLASITIIALAREHHIDHSLISEFERMLQNNVKE